MFLTWEITHICIYLLWKQTILAKTANLLKRPHAMIILWHDHQWPITPFYHDTIHFYGIIPYGPLFLRKQLLWARPPCLISLRIFQRNPLYPLVAWLEKACAGGGQRSGEKLEIQSGCESACMARLLPCRQCILSPSLIPWLGYSPWLLYLAKLVKLPLLISPRPSLEWLCFTLFTFIHFSTKGYRNISKFQTRIMNHASSPIDVFFGLW